MFEQQQPIEVDLGCGRGAFLVWAARSRPTVNFVGIDRLLGRLRKVAGKVDRAGLANVRLLRIEGSYFVKYLLPARSIAAYHIFFSDPWPKRRHHPRRLFDDEFVRELQRTLVPEGVVNIATDDEAYAQSIHRLFAASRQFVAESPDVLPVDGQTEFEGRCLAGGLPIFRMRWRSGAGISRDRPPESAAPDAVI